MPRALQLASLIACSVPLLAATPPAPSVGVFIEFDSEPGPASVQAMEQEVERILKPSGLQLDWRLTRENRGNEAFAGLVVLRFSGACRADRDFQPVDDFGTLGEIRTLASTRVDAGRVLPFTEVKCDEVRQALAYLRPGAGRQERQKALGLALGRVVAHEIYHILARSTKHASSGLAKSAEEMEDLVAAREIRFQKKDSEAIRDGVLAGVVVSASR